MEKMPITREGLEKLKNDLLKLEKEEKPRNIKAIEEARSHGDISENAEYHAAKERQAFLEGKINELKGVINRAEVIERDAGPADQVVFGRHVVLCDLDTDKEVTYQLVGAYESDPGGGKISIESPLGRELIGKALGDEVRVKTPRGLLEYEIVEVY
ncbi:MAG: transcription elongation factor GreA [Deltaproteobacteria bacterium]|jgi:transcription elongation factor GreA